MIMSSENELLQLKSNLAKADNRYRLTSQGGPLMCKLEFDHELWIDKYKPKSYDELLTDEKTNRELLTWMKSWDEIVFKKKFNLPETMRLKTNDLSSAGNLQFQKYKKPLEIEYVQSKHKILLIAGPPGTGKTSLAKIISKHCGYEPIVVNASDERTPEKLILRIYDTTMMHNLNLTKSKVSEKKPTCLILDEIDGISSDMTGKNSVKCIIDFIKDGKINKIIVNKAKKNILTNEGIFMEKRGVKDEKTFEKKQEGKEKDSSDSEEESFRDKENSNDNKAETVKNKNKKSNAVKRPIICICNDAYAKVLAILRKEALVYNIKRTDEKKMIERLYWICKKECLDIDNLTIKNLCEKTKYDIRTTLNCLQFVSYNRDNLQLLKTLAFDKLSILGRKDINEGLFPIWNHIFLSSKKFSERNTSLFNSIVNLFYSYGEFSTIGEGLFVNYLKIPNKESISDIEHRAKLTDVFSYEDVISKKINTSQYFELSKFQCLSATYIKSHYQVTTDKSEKFLEFPTLFIDFKKEKKINSRILNSIKDQFEENGHHSNISKVTLVTDMLPFIAQLIQPEIREINPELMNKAELLQLKQTVNLMYSMGIKFQEVKTDDDEKSSSEELSMGYEPNILRLLTFPNVNLKGKYHRLSENQRIIIKIEYERLKNLKKLTNDTLLIKEKNSNENDGVNLSKVNIMKKMNPMILGKKRNFSQFSSPEYKFVYKFNEGVTNCVRRTLNIKYFFK